MKHTIMGMTIGGVACTGMKVACTGIALLCLAGQCAQAAPVGKTAAKAAAPAKKMNPGRDYSKPFSQYADMVYKKVYPVWEYPEGKNSVVLTTVIDQDGTMGDTSASSSPKNENAERNASAALTQAQPLGPLPAGSSPRAKLIMTFNSTNEQHSSTATLLVKMEPIEGTSSAPEAPKDPASDDLVPGASPSVSPSN